MHTTNLRKVGGSVMLAVPPAILDLLNLKPGSSVGLRVDDDRLVIESKPRPRYTLDELLAQCTPIPDGMTATDAATDEDREWINLPPVGREL